MKPVIRPHSPLVVGIDPGPETSGYVEYLASEGRVWWSSHELSEKQVVWRLRALSPDWLVAIERPHMLGRYTTNETMFTSWVAGGFRTAARLIGLRCIGLYKETWRGALGVHGSGQNSQVRKAMIMHHGGTTRAAFGLRATPGPLYGVKSHATQALGVAWVASRYFEDRIEQPLVRPSREGCRHVRLSGQLDLPLTTERK
jgi:hypothetical protein